MPNTYPEGYLAQLRQRMNEHFSSDEIRMLCFDIGVDSEELGASGSKSILILNLITYLSRRNRLESLIRECEQARPAISWRPAPPENASSEKLRIFLCHASQDKLVVRDLHRKLLAAGFEPWLDEDNLLAGQDWELEISKAIQGCHVILVCLSQESVSKSGFVQKEIRYALDRALEQPEGTIFLIPLKLTPCDVPLSLKQYQWVNYYEESGYLNLLRALKARTDRL